jgi:hypothetical protein
MYLRWRTGGYIYSYLWSKSNLTTENKYHGFAYLEKYLTLASICPMIPYEIKNFSIL